MELPKLPEGYFWRVTDNIYLKNKPYVELRKKVWFFSIRIDAMWTTQEFVNIQEEVVYLACGIYDRQEEGKLARAALESVLGDYHS